MMRPQAGLDCNLPCIERGQFDAGCECRNSVATYRAQEMLDRNPMVLLLCRDTEYSSWSASGAYRYKAALEKIQKDPMHYKIGKAYP